MKRQDEKGLAYAGSQRQLQIYVNRRADELSRIILSALAPAPLHPAIHWVSPLEAAAFGEYRDAAFLRILGLDRMERQLSDFWPAGGPHWDGLAIICNGQTDSGYLLVEAKSYVDEMKSSCAASSQLSLAKIDSALAGTKDWLRVKKDINWKQGLYQAANRLAHLYFLREIAGVEAWLVNLCFTSDPHHRTSEEEWLDGLAAAKKKLGLPEIIPWVCNILLPACDPRGIVDCAPTARCKTAIPSR